CLGVALLRGRQMMLGAFLGLRLARRRRRGWLERPDGRSARRIEIGLGGIGSLELAERVHDLRMQALGNLALGRHTRREKVERDRGSIVDRRGQRAQVFRRIETSLQRGSFAAEIAYPLPVAPGSRDARLLEAALGFLTFTTRAPIARFRKDGIEKLSRTKEVEIAEEGVAV